MGVRLPKSLSEPQLKIVWSISRDSKPGTAGAPGIDHVTGAKYNSNINDNLSHLRQLIRAGNYSFKRLRPSPIPKKNGGERIIAVPTVRDRLLQRAILAHLEQDARFPKPSKISYGFTKGRTLIDAQMAALALRKSHPWAAQTDIAAFFDNISRPLLKKKVDRAVSSKAIRRLIHRAIDCEIDSSNPKANVIIEENGIKKGRGLRQGMPLSPALSNLLLKEFDAKLEKLGLKALRYADDLIIFGDSEAECLDALHQIKLGLKELNLKIPELSEDGKTKVCPPSKSVEFLGIDLKPKDGSYFLCAPNKRLEKIEARLKEICVVEYCIQKKQTLAQTLSHLDAFLIGHGRSLQIASDHDQFVSRLNALKKKYINELVISIVGEGCAKSLSSDKRAVLGIEEFGQTP